jgi:hypothetical protein
METPCFHCEVQTEFSCVKYRLNLIFKFLFTPISIIPWMLHTYLHIYIRVVLTRRTRWRSQRTFNWSSVLTVIGEHCTEKYFHVSVFKVIMQFYDIIYFQLIKWKLFDVWPNIIYHFWDHLHGACENSWLEVDFYNVRSHIYIKLLYNIVSLFHRIWKFFITLVNMLNAYMAMECMIQ